MSKAAAERLIAATIRSIAKHGLEGTTVTNIVAEADLTRAMIMKSFGNKDALLRAAAERFGQTYFDTVSDLIADAGPDPRDIVRAMVRADLHEDVLNPETITVLTVMRSLAHGDPEIRNFSSTRDGRLRDDYTKAIASSLGPRSSDNVLAKDLATATIAMLEGFWADYFLFVDRFDRAKAEKLVMMLLEPYWSKASTN